MIVSEDIVNAEFSQKTFFSTFEKKYGILDNLNEDSNPIVRTGQSTFNQDYFYIIVVVRGTLHLSVSSNDIDLHANDLITIKPCTHILFKESHCTFFTIIGNGYLINDIMHCNQAFGDKNRINAFTFIHLHLAQETTEALTACYLRLKRVFEREGLKMKEVAIRAYITAFIAKRFALATAENIVAHTKKNHQNTFYSEFLELLCHNYKKERSVKYYADQMHITPKYLSTITQALAGMPASLMIDNYVIYAIKQALYANEHNIKAVSEDFNFPNQSFFGRYFKRITGVSPNAYIKQNNKKSIAFMQQ